MILLDLKDSRPIYEQVVEKMQELMMLGILEEDGQMPSVRSLAMELSINPNTIQRAYGELERRGYIYSVKGRGSFVGSIHKLREARKQELSKKIGGLAKEARTIGMDRGDFVEMAAREYDQNGKTTSAGGLKAGQAAGSGPGGLSRPQPTPPQAPPPTPNTPHPTPPPAQTAAPDPMHGEGDGGGLEQKGGPGAFGWIQKENPWGGRCMAAEPKEAEEGRRND